MADFKTIAIASISVPDRLRAIEEDHALAIQASIVEHGLINPITVRHVPNQAKGKTPYVLVAGAHRLRAVELLDETEIEAMVIKADAEEAQLLEITENLFRNELSALDRAMFVMRYREIWERKHGKIDPKGGRPKNSLNLTELIADEAARGFSIHVAERLGLSVSAIERATRIAQKLRPELRQSLRGTAAADNQSLLLKLAKIEPARQRKIARAAADGMAIAEAVASTETLSPASATKTEQDALLDRLLSTWARSDETTRRAFLEHVAAGEASAEAAGGGQGD